MNYMYALILSFILSVSLYAKNSYEGIVTKVLQGGGYTYLQIQEKTKKHFWIAVTGVKIDVGTEVRFDEEMVVKNFKSKSIDKNFETIMFASNLQYRTDKKLALIETFLEKSPYQLEDTISIKELLANPKKFQGKKIKIRAKVVKTSDNIMKKNWIHLQDGTGISKEVGRVVFTSSKYLPKVGSIVTAQGIVDTDKDFGSGYIYKVIVENSSFQ